MVRHIFHEMCGLATLMHSPDLLPLICTAASILTSVSIFFIQPRLPLSLVIPMGFILPSVLPSLPVPTDQCAIYGTYTHQQRHQSNHAGNCCKPRTLRIQIFLRKHHVSRYKGRIICYISLESYCHSLIFLTQIFLSSVSRFQSLSRRDYTTVIYIYTYR